MQGYWKETEAKIEGKILVAEKASELPHCQVNNQLR